MRELSVFIDESGDAAFRSDFYLVTLAFHDQSVPLVERFAKYDQALRDQQLDFIPFHFNPLLNGNDNYQWKSMRSRKRQLAAFTAFVQYLPIQYATFLFEKRGRLDDPVHLAGAIEAEVLRFLRANLACLQGYDKVKIYYDGGQSLVTRALHGAIEGAVAAQATVYRDAVPRNYRLAQVADYLCGIELTAAKYERHVQTKTDVEFFGSARDFKKNFLKKMRKKRIA